MNMSVAREHEAASPQPEQAVAAPAADSELTRLASLIGNHAFTRAVAGNRIAGSPQPPGTPVIARQDESEEESSLNEGQKAHLKAQVVGPMRAGAGRLVGDKPDTRSVVRHLKPLQGTMRGFAAKGEAAHTLRSGADELGVDITILESLNLSQKQSIFLARNAWQTARKHLARTKVELARVAKAQKVEASELAEVNSQLDALSQQIAATSQDLTEAPRTQEDSRPSSRPPES